MPTIAFSPPNLSSIADCLYNCLARQLPSDRLSILEQQRVQIALGAPDHIFFAAFSAVPRHTGQTSLQLTSEEANILADWDASRRTLDEAGRALLLLSVPHEDVVSYSQRLTQLLATAEVREMVAFYRTLPLLPKGDRLVSLAREGIRSNMKVVFESVALRNPYPARHFDEEGWNQMVLKALFVGSSVDEIWHLNERANSILARMVVGYARERRSAGRPVPPQLWGLVDSFAREDIMADLEMALNDSDPIGREARALAVARSFNSQMRSLLETRPELRNC
jgi:hypothetical protein